MHPTVTSLQVNIILFIRHELNIFLDFCDNKVETVWYRDPQIYTQTYTQTYT